MSVLVAFHVKGSGVTPKAPTLSPSVAAGRPLRRSVPVLKQCFQSFWVLRTASKQASIKDLENKHNASSGSARISFFFFFASLPRDCMQIDKSCGIRRFLPGGRADQAGVPRVCL